MKRLVAALPLAAAATALAGCYIGPVQGDVYASPLYSTDVTYHAYYDNYYGQIYDGYWTDDTFYYRTDPSHYFQKDTGGHFRQKPTQGFQEIQGRMFPDMPSHPPSADVQLTP
jgi:hypothetical protein